MWSLNYLMFSFSERNMTKEHRKECPEEKWTSPNIAMKVNSTLVLQSVKSAILSLGLILFAGLFLWTIYHYCSIVLQLKTRVEKLEEQCLKKTEALSMMQRFLQSVSSCVHNVPLYDLSLRVKSCVGCLWVGLVCVVSIESQTKIWINYILTFGPFYIYTRENYNGGNQIFREVINNKLEEQFTHTDMKQRDFEGSPNFLMFIYALLSVYRALRLK